MKKVKKVLVLLLLLTGLSSLFCAGSDVIVLMDASGTILPWFDQINSRILPDVTRKFVRQGDTFHLVSFNARVNLEIVQPVQTETDVSRIVSRFLLLYPLGQNSDFLSGLQYTWQYASGLDQQKNKIIIVVSDGIFNPPSASRYATFSPEEVKSELNVLSQRIRGAGWSVYYIKLPFPESAVIRNLDGTLLSAVKETTTDTDGSKGFTSAEGASSENSYTDISSNFTESLSIPVSEYSGEDEPVNFIDTVFSLPEVTFPENLGRKGRFFTLPLKIHNPSKEQINLELTEVLWNGVNILETKAFLSVPSLKSRTLKAPIALPDTLPLGHLEMPIQLRFSENKRVVPQYATVHLELIAFSIKQFVKTGGFVVYAAILVIISLIIILALFIIIARRTENSTSRVVRLAQKDNQDTEREKASVSLRDVSSRSKDILNAQVDTESVNRRATVLAQAKGSQTTASGVSDSNASGANRAALLASWGTQARADTIGKNPETDDKKRRYELLNKAGEKHIARSSDRPAASSHDAIAARANSSIMLELFVYNQNRAIGRRNVHMLKAGSRQSIGGGRSSFLVFLVPFPHAVAEVRYDGVSCDLAILKPAYFPYETKSVITDCLNKDFTIVSDKEYEVTFLLREFEDPVKKLNRLLTSITY